MKQDDEWPKRLTAQIGDGIREARAARGLSAAELSDRTANLGYRVPRNTITNLENGRKGSLPLHELLVLSAVLQAPLSALVCYPDEDGQMEFLPGRKAAAGSVMMDVTSQRGSYQEGPRFELLAKQLWYCTVAGQWEFLREQVRALSRGLGRFKPADRRMLLEEGNAMVGEAAEAALQCPGLTSIGDVPEFDKLVKAQMEARVDGE